jgi:hypothetical protein
LYYYIGTIASGITVPAAPTADRGRPTAEFSGSMPRNPHDTEERPVPPIVCKPKSLPIDKIEAATRRAVEINPANARQQRRIARILGGRPDGERRIAVVVGRRWPVTGDPLSVSFLDNASRPLRARILSHMNAWGEAANVVFTETKGTGQVRVARLDTPADMAGYWSYVGTEILEIEPDQPTLNLEAFTMKTSESEFRRVVRHEAGHTLGFDHEHMRADIVARIDRAKAVKYFFRTDGWTPEEVDAQVLTPLDRRSIMGTLDSDPVSIMCYDLPAAIMKDRKAVQGGADINPRDFAFAAMLYPKGLTNADVQSAPVPASAAAPAVPTDQRMARGRPSEDRDTFHIVVLDEFRPEADGTGKAAAKPRWAQVLAMYGGARVTTAMRLRAAAGESPTKFGRIIAMHERIREYTNRTGGTLPGDAEMLAFGADLFESLIQGDVRRLYDEARARQRAGRLDLVLTSMIPWISEKPWEFAYDAARGTFLATEDLHFVRNVLTGVPADPVVMPDGPLRILVAAAQPVGFGRLSIEQEVGVITRGFTPLIDAKLADVTVIAQITPERLHQALTKEGPYQIVHFIGHGVYDDERKQGCLVFVNERGGEYTLGEREVREIFCRRGLSLVFLNACESGRGGRADFNKGVAQSLVAHGLPALVANQYSVLDSSATTFAQRFYWALANGFSVGEAARESRIAVNYGISGEPIDWAVPVLYAREPSLTLCARPASSITAPAGGAFARPLQGRRDCQVGVWDVDDVFPALGTTLARLNEAQTTFGFDLVDTSVPMDAWDVNAEEGESFLWAERFADRLRRKAGELGVDVLACVTRHWLRDDNWLYLYGWWPDSGTPPVILFSIAGLEELKPEGRDTDRAIANAIVSGLAGFYGRTGTHEKGARNCPLYFTEHRLLEHLVAIQKFDAGCRRKLTRALGDRLPALEALLTTFATD